MSQAQQKAREKNQRQARENVAEDFRVAALVAVNRFLAGDEPEMSFPSSFTSTERLYIHRLAAGKGLKSKSQGSGVNRFLTVSKRSFEDGINCGSEISLAHASLQYLVEFTSEHPLSVKEKHELIPVAEKSLPIPGGDASRSRSRSMGKLNNGVSHIPPSPLALNTEIVAERKNLPIFVHKKSIVSAIQNHQVTIITSENGTGKSTQIPQYIMEEASEVGRPCRIVCAEPRRLVAVSLAERVAAERNEMVGQIVGYQIRLESRVSLKTNLTFCTNGILLRSFMGLEIGSVDSLTHVIIDEVHERNKQTDFLLIVLKDALQRHPNLRLILMSATIDIEPYQRYFEDAFHVNIPGYVHPVTEIYLEDILAYSKYLQCEKTSDGSSRKHATLDRNLESYESKVFEVESDSDGFLQNENQELEVIDSLDSAILDGFMFGNFGSLIAITEEDPKLVNYEHSCRKVTPLMAAAGHGEVDVVKRFLCLGADPSKKSSNGWTAKEFALKTKQAEAVEVLETFKPLSELFLLPESHEVIEEIPTCPERNSSEDILKLYLSSFKDDGIDHSLVAHTIMFIHETYEGQESDAILVFLPSYEDIIKVKEFLPEDSSSITICILHSQMMIVDHSLVFKKPPRGHRKVVLSTNIAETSVTVPDIVFIIDTGKVKEKNFNPHSSVSTLTVSWISKASANQRKGRAGRCKPGYVIRLFSRSKFSSFRDHQTPEILRTPILELCLQTKMLAHPSTMPISEFLSKALDPPSSAVTHHALQMLKSIEALDINERVTELGNQLIDLPLEPQLGKMLLCSIMLKCLDPVLTIVCCLSFRDPFCLATRPDQRELVLESRKKFAGNSMSDHMVLLRAFQGWQASVAEGMEYHFCKTNQISSATMEMITGMRGQILGQLRAQGFVRTKGSGDIRDLNSNSENWAVVKGALAAGAYPKIVKFNKETNQFSCQKEGNVGFHMSSVLGDAIFESNGHSKATGPIFPTDWFIYDEMQKVGHLWTVCGVTAVSSITIALFAGHCRLSSKSLQGSEDKSTGNVYLDQTSDSEVEEYTEKMSTSTLKIDDFLSFTADTSIVNLIFEFRQKWSAGFIRKLQSPNKCLMVSDEALVKAVVKLLSVEDASIGLTQPFGIGQRPRLLPTEPKYFRSPPGFSSSLLLPDFSSSLLN